MNAFDWRGPSQSGIEAVEQPARMYPQLAYYWRKKAGLTGTRDKPVRGWRDQPCYFADQGDADREALNGR